MCLNNRTVAFALAFIMAVRPALATAQEPASVSEFFEGENEFMKHAEMLERDRRDLAEKEIGVKFNSVIREEREFLSAALDGLGKEIRAINEAQGPLLAEHAALVRAMAAPSLDEYAQILTTAATLEGKARELLARLVTARADLKSLAKVEAFGVKSCLESVKLLDADMIRAEPMNAQIERHLDYTKYGSFFGGQGDDVAARGNIFFEDPVLDAYIFGIEAATLVGIVAYAIVNNVSIASMFGFVAAKGGFVLTLSGPGAAVFLAVTLAVVVIGTLHNDRENEKRKKRAEQKLEIQIKHFEIAKKWYEERAIRTPEFQEMGRRYCQSNRFADELRKQEKDVEVIRGDALQVGTDVDQSIATVSTALDDIATRLASYRARLRKSISEQLVAQVEDAKLGGVEATAIWRDYNESIKPIAAGLVGTTPDSSQACMAMDTGTQDLEQRIAAFYEAHAVTIKTNFARRELDAMKRQADRVIEALASERIACWEELSHAQSN